MGKADANAALAIVMAAMLGAGCLRAIGPVASDDAASVADVAVADVAVAYDAMYQCTDHC